MTSAPVICAIEFAYAAQTAVNGGSELLIFVVCVAHSQFTLDDLGDDDIDE